MLKLEGEQTKVLRYWIFFLQSNIYKYIIDDDIRLEKKRKVI